MGRKRLYSDEERKRRRDYQSHRQNAKHRGIPFKLTFDEWWSIWEPNYHLRGSKKGCMCMCRTLDEGGYEVGNVRIDVVEANHDERSTAHKVRSAQSPKYLRYDRGNMSIGYAGGITGCSKVFADPASIVWCESESDEDFFDFSDLMC